jgi:hypothetical protein
MIFCGFAAEIERGKNELVEWVLSRDFGVKDWNSMTLG